MKLNRCSPGNLHAQIRIAKYSACAMPELDGLATELLAHIAFFLGPLPSQDRNVAYCCEELLKSGPAAVAVAFEGLEDDVAELERVEVAHDRVLLLGERLRVFLVSRWCVRRDGGASTATVEKRRRKQPSSPRM